MHRNDFENITKHAEEERQRSGYDIEMSSRKPEHKVFMDNEGHETEHHKLPNKKYNAQSNDRMPEVSGTFDPSRKSRNT